MASDLLEGTAEVHSSSALVIGGGLVGLEPADFLSAQGKRVTLVEMLPDVGADMVGKVEYDETRLATISG